METALTWDKDGDSLIGRLGHHNLTYRIFLLSLVIPIIATWIFYGDFLIDVRRIFLTYFYFHQLGSCPFKKVL